MAKDICEECGDELLNGTCPSCGPDKEDEKENEKEEDGENE